MRHWQVCIFALLWLGVSAACSDAASPPVRRMSEPLSLQVDCTASPAARKVVCTAPRPSSPGRSAIIIGGPNHDTISIVSDSISVYADTFAFDVTIQNLRYRWLGTTDGITPDTAGIKIFFYDSLQVDTAFNASLPSFIRVANPDGHAVFVRNDTTEFYKYDQMLAHCEISRRKRWKFQFSNVEHFSFSLKVSTEAIDPLPNDCVAHDQGGGG